MPDTFYTTAPGWTWWIVLYFFVGGIAGGSLFLAALLHLFGRPADRPIIRLGYYVAFFGAIVSGLLLIVDLHRPDRFWHMIVESETGYPMLKWWSPMSVGSWGLLVFGAFATLGALGALYDAGHVGWRLFRPLSRGWLATIIAILGAASGFFLAGYTGVLLSVTNRPLWADSTWLGVLFLFSGGSTAAATLILLALWRGVGVPTTIHYLSDFDKAALVLELIALVIFVASLGGAAIVFVHGWGIVWGLLLVLGVLAAGILLPLAISTGRLVRVQNRLVTAASLVLIGGFLLRFVVLLASNGVHAPATVVDLP